MNGDLIQWTKRCLLETTVEISIEGNAMKRHPVEAWATKGSPMSPILIAIYTSGLIKLVEEYVTANGLASVNNLR
jgi:hypothetical protein